MTEPFLPHDVTRCPGDGCSEKHRCKRFLAPWGRWQPAFAFAPWHSSGADGVFCRQFIDADQPGYQNTFDPPRESYTLSGV